MKRLIALALLCAAPLAVSAAPAAGCDAACERNVQAVFHGPTRYTMRVDDAAHAHISVTWVAKRNRNRKLKPVRFEGTAPVRLRHTTLHSVEMDEDVCHAVITVLELGDEDFDVYQVPVRNTQCNS